VQMATVTMLDPTEII